MADARHLLLFFSAFLLTLSSTFDVAAQMSPPNQDLNPNFNPSMAIVIVVLISAFFFLGFFSIYFRQCAGDSDYFAGSVRGGVVRFRRQPTQRGLAPEVLATFPTLVYLEVKELKIGKGALECAVCLTEFEDDDKLRLLPGCSHVFHPDCIDAWLSSHVTCPVCRGNLADTAAAAAAASDHNQEEHQQPTEAPATDSDVPLPAETSADQVVIVVDRAESQEERQRKLEAVELAELGSRRREHLSRSVRRPQKFPRSHSTGHSLAPPRDSGSLDRYTLRLPDNVMKEIFAAPKFHRSSSCVAIPAAGDGSSRRGYRYWGGGGGGVGEGSSRGGRSIRLGRSDRWPSFFVRTLSARFPSWAGGRRGADVDVSVKKGEDEGSTNKGKFAGVMTPLDCLVGAGATAKADGDDESATAVLARRA